MACHWFSLNAYSINDQKTGTQSLNMHGASRPSEQSV